VVVADIPFPIRSAQEAADAIMAKVTPRTKLAMLSHVTSSSGLILPIESIVPELERKDIRTLIDGAHAPGMIPVDLSALGASYYTANCHKWICSPKGSAFLYVRHDLHPGFRPLALSNDAEKPKAGRAQFLTEFEYVGTNDMTAFYAIPDAIRVMGGMLEGGFASVMRHNRELCLRGRDIICKRLGIEPAAPDAMLGTICTMILPPHPPELRARLAARPTKYHDALWDRLLETWRLQVPVWTVAQTGHRTCRISAQLYNSVEQYEYLAEALASELEAERRQ
jgi:isopenicillin-N epimerase